jgi:WD40 repeat protein
VTPGGRHVVSASDDKTLQVWELASGRCGATLEGHTDGVRARGQGGVADLQRADYERRLELLDVEKTFRDQTDLKMNTTEDEHYREGTAFGYAFGITSISASLYYMQKDSKYAQSI